MRGVKVVLLAAVLLLGLQSITPTLAANTPPGAPTSIILTLIPPRLPADGGVYPAAVISLVDSNANPTAAESPITVFLTSSSPNIAAVPDSVTIAAGAEYVVANITTTVTPGGALITAHAEGYGAPQDVQLGTSTPSGFPSKLIVFSSPSEFLARSDVGIIRVEVVDAAGQPSKAITSIPVQLTSSNSSIARLNQGSIAISAGAIFASGSFVASESGTTVITAVSTGYSSGITSVVVDKPCVAACAPNKIGITLLPGVLPADGKSYKSMQLSLETQNGGPAVAGSDTIVQLTSDGPQVASVQNLIVIPAGVISILTNITTSALASRANLTATSAGLIPITMAVTTVIPAPSSLRAYVAPPSTAFSANGNYPILVVQLQDSNGNPARARQNTNLVVTSSNGSLLASFVSLSIPQGNDYVFSYLHTQGIGLSNLKVSSQGLVSSLVPLVSKPGPVSMILAPPATGFIYANQTWRALFIVSFDGSPLKGVNVTWSTTGGAILNPQTGTTDSSGSTTTLFTPPSYGKYNVTASAFTPQTGPISRTVSFVVAVVPVKPTPTLVQVLLGFWYYLAAAVAVVVIAAVYLLRMRRKKQRAEIEAGFEVV